MSNDKTVAPSEKAQTAVPPVVDTLTQMALKEIPSEQARYKALAQQFTKQGNAEAAQLAMEMGGTVLSLLLDVVRGTIELRTWSFIQLKELADSTVDHLEAVETRLDMVEDFGGDTSILPEDAEILLKVIGAGNFLAQQLISGPFPIQERDAEGKQKLAEVIALCEQAGKIVTESTLESSDDELSDDDSDETEESANEPN